MSKETRTRNGNRIIAALNDQDRSQLLAQLEPYALKHSAVLSEIGDELEYVYFPDTGMVSLVTHTEEGGTIEVGVVGYEGVVGLSVFLGIDESQYRLLVQGDGQSLRIKAKTFKAECARLDSLQTVLRRYTHALLTQITQAAICNRFHDVEARLCRWLLQSRDCMKSDELYLTQEFLAIMLGVHRPAVTIAAGILQNAGLINYNRGHVTILAGTRLESASCECYRVVKDAFKWLTPAD
jgi:CRP-like cAMP-binding protein